MQTRTAHSVQRLAADLGEQGLILDMGSSVHISFVSESFLMQPLPRAFSTGIKRPYGEDEHISYLVPMIAVNTTVLQHPIFYHRAMVLSRRDTFPLPSH
jgi:hypothetical protein